MDLRDHITTETSALAQRLIAAAESASEKVRLEADTTVAALRRELEEIRATLECETSRAAALADQLRAEISRNSTLTTGFDAASARIEALTAELERERSMHSALAARLEDQSTRHDSIASQLEKEMARARALATDLESATSALRAVEEARTQAAALVEGTSNENRSLREMLESARAEAIRASEALEAEGAQKALLRQGHEIAVAELQTQLEAAAASTKALEASLADAHAKSREAEHAGVQDRELRQQVEEQAESLRTKDKHVEAAKTAVARMRVEVEEAHAISDAASAEMSELKGRVAQVTSVLSSAATSLDALASSRTLTEVFASLVRELATTFAHAAIFRVKGNHLEGELAVGVDDAIDIQKIIIPLGMRSTMTKAATDGSVQRATREEIGELPSPFGGSPAFVIAAPLLFEGEVLAVAYADTDGVLADAHAAFASVLVRHANAVLTGLALEIRTSRQLRDYARTLLKEVEAMFTADVQAGIPESERVKRLRANIGFARDLYGQRAVLESPVATNALEDEIGRMKRGADQSDPFARALATSLDASEDALRAAGAG